MAAVFWLGLILSAVCIWNIAVSTSDWRHEIAWVIGAVGGALLVAFSKGAFS